MKKSIIMIMMIMLLPLSAYGKIYSVHLFNTESTPLGSKYMNYNHDNVFKKHLARWIGLKVVFKNYKYHSVNIKVELKYFFKNFTESGPLTYRFVHQDSVKINPRVTVPFGFAKGYNDNKWPRGLYKIELFFDGQYYNEYFYSIE